ncbi:MAG: EpsD family peptidyl-prolyl cis-trans isomerase [Burkholderiales bacterium]|jgi:EpsD family peptidyl-prolyl cis-trans isomerase
MTVRFPRARRAPRIAACVLAASVLAACGGGSEAPKTTQAVARVNDREISVHQVNLMAQRLPGNLPAERIAEARRAIVNGLVEQETLVQYATEHKLDREAQTMQQIEAARREVLARVALERLGAQSPRPTSDEVQEYFDKNPGLFAKRRVYRFDEIVLPGVPVEWAAIEKQIASARSLREVSTALRARGIDPPVTQGVVRATEALPMNLLASFAQKKPGEIVVWRQPPRMIIGQVVDARDAPVDAARAQPVIEQALAVRKRQETVAAEVKKLSEAAKVSYLGEFAQAAPAAQTSGAPAPVDAAAVVEQALGKGAAGLKK